MKFRILFIFLLLLTACSGTSYENEDVIAVLKGEEIKGRDILALYPLNDEHIEIYIKEEIIVIEAKEMGIHVSREEIERNKNSLYPGLDPSEILQHVQENNRQFYEEQAVAFDIQPEEYYEIWRDTYYSRDPYIQEYMNEKFFSPASAKGIDFMKQESIDKLNKEIETHLDELIDLYKKNGDLIIN
ncbi:hypothetical protein [Halalkalibacter sp. APA_J-10(15)]|uniref:hypothetical protein n=1 Tax=Halalkalibacter sp. APA_J-10(15) TaxID=2933805 RepID=UPI001FF3AA0A|nr:hypothetical protein [Halalkalibacter sp. APA_J-10(15)]MCK0470662.1 hypothetical protein [Halalkalibacter sp. APA_J-10(15)]